MLERLYPDCVLLGSSAHGLPDALLFMMFSKNAPASEYFADEQLKVDVLAALFI